MAARTNSETVEMLKAMLRIRAAETAILELSQRKEPEVIGSVHLCAGQEAVPVGALAALGPADRIVATYRGHGWALASGVTLTELIGEVCHRVVGLNGGRGGSAYLMAPHTRFVGENSIVGAGVPIACGLALAMQSQGTGGVALVSIGDGAMNQGATHEGLAFAAAKNLPLLLVVENNGWSEMTQTSAIVRSERLASRANGYGIKGVTIDGTDPLVVRDTIRLAAEAARAGKGPLLVECLVPRLWGHYNRDIEHYRSKEDRAAAATRDPLLRVSAKLAADGQVDAAGLAALQAEADAEIAAVVEAVLAAPKPQADTAGRHVWAQPRAEPVAAPAPEPEAVEMTYIQAVNAALDRELAAPETLVYGEDVGRAGGIFAATRNLQRGHGEARVFDTPIAESAILGSAVGAALMGMRPIVEIMWADFMLVALDQLINQAANVRYVTGGRSGVPLVVRTQQGSTPGSCAQHSQSLEALLAHIPGLRVALPATPQDAYSVLRAAAACDDPCIVIEARGLYGMRGPVVQHDAAGPVGGARLRRSGKDGLVLTWGTMVGPALEAAEQLATAGRQVSVLDLVWLSPLDEQAIRAAVAATEGPVVIAHEANRTGGFGAEIGMRVLDLLPAGSVRPIRRVASPDVRLPASPLLRAALLPNAASIAAALQPDGSA